ncbi:MAG: class I SAM-dependent methyltransferase [Actinomycetota bacterium]|nr:class I SAM-dependent methyltransferase [Actinomycetota bacterium]
MFVHQDGIILTATVRALAELGILQASLAGERALSELYPDLVPGGFGYLRVGLRCLASQGWFEDSPTGDPATTVIRWSAAGRRVAPYLDRYVAAGKFLAGFDRREDEAWSAPWDDRQVASFAGLSELAAARWNLGPEVEDDARALITTHLDAALVVPAMIWLSEADRLGEDGPSLPDDALGDAVASVLRTLGWVDHVGAWTSAGREAAALSVHFGMAGSYLPMLARLPELFGGRTTVTADSGDGEWHVHRRINVLASAAAHRRYFADANDLFLELFSREPVNEQPRFIADMGCGDGSWLVHLHELIMQRTLRGELAEECPLLMVGIDYNQAALEQARRLLEAAGIPALLIEGDVGDPDQVAVALAEHGLAIQDGLHIRAFIDHNRAYRGAETDAGVRGVSSAAYVGPGGRSLDAAAVEVDLVAHMRRWTPHVAKHGLVVLEAHCVDPSIVRDHLGATHSVAFDGYHGYSRQYPVEHTAFLDSCRLAGLRFVSEWERRYPVSRPFVAVTLSRLLAADPGGLLPPPRRARCSPPRAGSPPRRPTWRTAEPSTSCCIRAGTSAIRGPGARRRLGMSWRERWRPWKRGSRPRAGATSSACSTTARVRDWRRSSSSRHAGSAESSSAWSEWARPWRCISSIYPRVGSPSASSYCVTVAGPGSTRCLLPAAGSDPCPR